MRAVIVPGSAAPDTPRSKGFMVPSGSFTAYVMPENVTVAGVNGSTWLADEGGGGGGVDATGDGAEAAAVASEVPAVTERADALKEMARWDAAAAERNAASATRREPGGVAMRT